MTSLFLPLSPSLISDIFSQSFYICTYGFSNFNVIEIILHIWFCDLILTVNISIPLLCHKLINLMTEIFLYKHMPVFT